jgi:hypothetical protein
MVFFMFLHEHSWDPPAVHVAIFQHCHHFQRIEADIQLRTQFANLNPPIRTGELIETLFISWCDSCAWPPERGLSFTSLSPLLKRATHRLTVPTSTVWSP